MNISDIDFSVVIPAYNAEKTLQRAVNSVLAQTYLKKIKEIIIVDDGSTDQTIAISKRMKQHLAIPLVITHQSNSGVSTARNRGIRLAKGTWIALLDSDDEWIPSKIEKQFKAIKNHSDIDFIGGAVNNIPLSILGKKITSLYKANITDICIKNFPQPSTAVFKKSIFNEIGGFDVSQRYAEDGNYFIKISYKYNYYYLPEQLVIFDKDKKAFGISGLSANLKGMYEGNLKNIKEFRQNGWISLKFYLFIRFFYWMKYIRRILLTKIRG